MSTWMTVGTARVRVSLLLTCLLLVVMNCSGIAAADLPCLMKNITISSNTVVAVDLVSCRNSTLPGTVEISLSELSIVGAEVLLDLDALWSNISRDDPFNVTRVRLTLASSQFSRGSSFHIKNSQEADNAVMNRTFDALFSSLAVLNSEFVIHGAFATSSAISFSNCSFAMSNVTEQPLHRTETLSGIPSTFQSHVQFLNFSMSSNSALNVLECLFIVNVSTLLSQVSALSFLGNTMQILNGSGILIAGSSFMMTTSDPPNAHTPLVTAVFVANTVATCAITNNSTFTIINSIIQSASACLEMESRFPFDDSDKSLFLISDSSHFLFSNVSLQSRSQYAGSALRFDRGMWLYNRSTFAIIGKSQAILMDEGQATLSPSESVSVLRLSPRLLLHDNSHWTLSDSLLQLWSSCNVSMNKTASLGRRATLTVDSFRASWNSSFGTQNATVASSECVNLVTATLVIGSNANVSVELVDEGAIRIGSTKLFNGTVWFGAVAIGAASIVDFVEADVRCDSLSCLNESLLYFLSLSLTSSGTVRILDSVLIAATPATIAPSEAADPWFALFFVENGIVANSSSGVEITGTVMNGVHGISGRPHDFTGDGLGAAFLVDRSSIDVLGTAICFGDVSLTNSAVIAVSRSSLVAGFSTVYFGRLISTVGISVAISNDASFNILSSNLNVTGAGGFGIAIKGTLRVVSGGLLQLYNITANGTHAGQPATGIYIEDDITATDGGRVELILANLTFSGYCVWCAASLIVSTSSYVTVTDALLESANSSVLFVAVVLKLSDASNVSLQYSVLHSSGRAAVVNIGNESSDVVKRGIDLTGRSFLSILSCQLSTGRDGYGAAIAVYDAIEIHSSGFLMDGVTLQRGSDQGVAFNTSMILVATGFKTNSEFEGFVVDGPGSYVLFSNLIFTLGALQYGTSIGAISCPSITCSNFASFTIEHTRCDVHQSAPSLSWDMTQTQQSFGLIPALWITALLVATATFSLSNVTLSNGSSVVIDSIWVSDQAVVSIGDLSLGVPTSTPNFSLVVALFLRDVQVKDNATFRVANVLWVSMMPGSGINVSCAILCSGVSSEGLGSSALFDVLDLSMKPFRNFIYIETCTALAGGVINMSRITVAVLSDVSSALYVGRIEANDKSAISLSHASLRVTPGNASIISPPLSFSLIYVGKVAVDGSQVKIVNSDLYCLGQCIQVALGNYDVGFGVDFALRNNGIFTFYNLSLECTAVMPSSGVIAPEAAYQQSCLRMAYNVNIFNHSSLVFESVNISTSNGSFAALLMDSDRLDLSLSSWITVQHCHIEHNGTYNAFVMAMHSTLIANNSGIHLVDGTVLTSRNGCAWAIQPIGQTHEDFYSQFTLNISLNSSLSLIDIEVVGSIVVSTPLSVLQVGQGSTMLVRNVILRPSTTQLGCGVVFSTLHIVEHSNFSWVQVTVLNVPMLFNGTVVVHYDSFLLFDNNTFVFDELCAGVVTFAALKEIPAATRDVSVTVSESSALFVRTTNLTFVPASQNVIGSYVPVFCFAGDVVVELSSTVSFSRISLGCGDIEDGGAVRVIEFHSNLTVVESSLTVANFNLLPARCVLAVLSTLNENATTTFDHSSLTFQNFSAQCADASEGCITLGQPMTVLSNRSLLQFESTDIRPPSTQGSSFLCSGSLEFDHSEWFIDGAVRMGRIAIVNNLTFIQSDLTWFGSVAFQSPSLHANVVMATQGSSLIFSESKHKWDDLMFDGRIITVSQLTIDSSTFSVRHISVLLPIPVGNLSQLPQSSSLFRVGALTLIDSSTASFDGNCSIVILFPFDESRVSESNFSIWSFDTVLIVGSVLKMSDMSMQTVNVAGTVMRAGTLSILERSTWAIMRMNASMTNTSSFLSTSQDSLIQNESDMIIDEVFIHSAANSLQHPIFQFGSDHSKVLNVSDGSTLQFDRCTVTQSLRSGSNNTNRSSSMLLVSIVAVLGYLYVSNSSVSVANNNFIIDSSLSLAASSVVAIERVTIGVGSSVQLATNVLSVQTATLQNSQGLTCFYNSQVRFGSNSSLLLVDNNQCYSRDGIWSSDSIVLAERGALVYLSALCNRWNDSVCPRLDNFPLQNVTTFMNSSKCQGNWKTKSHSLAPAASRLSQTQRSLLLERTTSSHRSSTYLTPASLSTFIPSRLSLQLSATETLVVGSTAVDHTSSRSLSHTSSRSLSFSASKRNVAVLRSQAQTVVEVASSVTTLVTCVPLSLLSGPAAGLPMQRAMMQMQLAACDYSINDYLDLATSPTSLGIGKANGRFIRGAVVGNIALLAGVTLTAAIAAVMRRHFAKTQGREMTLWRAAASLALPGWLAAPLGFLLQPLTSVSVATVVHSSEGAGASDAALGVFGLAVSAVLCGCATWVVTAGFGAAGRPFDRRRWALWLSTSRFPAPVRALFAAVCPTVVWRDVERGSLFVKRYETVFAGKRAGRVWFAAVELWASFATGVIGGVMPPDEATCQRLLIAMCVLQVGFLVLVVALRPYSTPFDRLLSFTSAVVGAVWNIVALVPVDAAALALSAGQIWLSVLSLVLLVAQLLLSGRFARGLRRAEALALSVFRVVANGAGSPILPCDAPRDSQTPRTVTIADLHLQVAACLEEPFPERDELLALLIRLCCSRSLEQ